jgi:NAD-dependent SIR2 family protein deacetylase
MIVMGTALAVSPFNMLVEMVPKNCHQVLINRENTI